MFYYFGQLNTGSARGKNQLKPHISDVIASVSQNIEKTLPLETLDLKLTDLSFLAGSVSRLNFVVDDKLNDYICNMFDLCVKKGLLSQVDRELMKSLHPILLYFSRFKHKIPHA